MKDVTKEKENPRDMMFQKELETLSKAERILDNRGLPREELQAEYRLLRDRYEKLLREMMKITRVGDVNYKKLMEANDQVRTQKSKLEALNKELQKANAAKDKLYSIIAHDLRNPLEFLLFASDLVENENGRLSEESLTRYAGRVFKTAKNMSELLENLLQWSRTQYGEIECQPQRIDLYLLAGDNIEFLMENAKRKNINVTLAIPEGTWAFADENMVTCVLRNLIGNAIKFTDAGGRVEISAREEGDFLVTAVRDTGVGIAQERLAALFSMDRNHVGSGTANEKSSGLGLILCREFVEKNGGKIWVESETGKGSLFAFSLPKASKE